MSATLVKELRERVDNFMDQHVFPRELEYWDFVEDPKNVWQYPPWFAGLKEKAKEARKKADEAKEPYNNAKSISDASKKVADEKQSEADAAQKAYDDCMKKVKEKCDKIKAAIAQAEAERIKKEEESG